MNAAEKLELEWVAGYYNDAVPNEDLKLKKSYAEKLARVMAGVNTDWKWIPVRTGIGDNHYVGISGGDDIFRYSTGISYNSVAGVMKGSDRNTLNGSVVLSYLGKMFQFTNNVSFGINSSQNSPYGDYYQYVSMNPYWEPYDENGVLVKNFETVQNKFFSIPVENPLWNAMSGSFNHSNYNSFSNNFNVTFKPVNYLQVSGRISFSKNNSKSEDFTSPQHTSFRLVEDVLRRGRRSYYSSESSNWAANLTANYYK